MINFLKKKPKQKQPPVLLDIDGRVLNEGDEVETQRYDLGLCKITLEGQQYFYVSIQTGNKCSYTKMIDAITGNQKVKKQ